MDEKQRIRDIGEVFTPQDIVVQMVDLITDLQKIKTTVLEPSVGEGVFLCEILRRKLNTDEPEDAHTKCTKALQSIYGVDIMLDNVRKTRENLLKIACEHCGLDPQSPENNGQIIAEWKGILEKNIRWGDTLLYYEAIHEDDDILYLKNLGKEGVKDLEFFNYQTNKWEKFYPLNNISEEIALQRNKEYRTSSQQKTLF
ncbi:MAG: N-6 DNA methylase [Bacteroidales bacterium]|jgi:hypothetical protein|nr:N-6 DNA methylase [Bacteroidales bacterium]